MIDLSAVLIEALESPQGRKLLDRVVDERVRAALAERDSDGLVDLGGLARLLGVSRAAAKMKVHRCSELRGLAILIDSRPRWRRSEVTAWLGTRRRK